MRSEVIGDCQEPYGAVLGGAGSGAGMRYLVVVTGRKTEVGSEPCPKVIDKSYRPDFLNRRESPE
jgi:hypothetical protein